MQPRGRRVATLVSMAIRIEKRDGDADAYIELVRDTIAGALKASRVEEAYVIHIDNWFDRKWMKFSGNRVMPADLGSGVPWTETRDACHLPELTLPPFSPNRVVAWTYYSWNAYSGEFEAGPSEFIPHVWQSSDRNLERRVADVGDSVAFVWFTGNTEVNGRGSLMTYLSRSGVTETWFASLVREGDWKVQTVAGIAKDDVKAFAEQGRELDRARRERIMPEEEALSRELHRAVDAGSLVRVTELIGDDVDLEGRDELGRTPLLSALYAAEWDCAELLLSAGANPFQQDYGGMGALHMCSFEPGRGPEDERVLRKLLVRKVDIEARRQSGATPLMVAAGNGRVSIVELLLDEAAELEATDESRETALHYACRRGKFDVVQVLLERGARVSARDKLRSTPIFKAVRCGDSRSVKLLHAAGASVTLKNKKGWTPAEVAKAKGHTDLLELLKRLGATI